MAMELQALMMRLYRYDVEFRYLEGNKLVIADTLSRAFLSVPEYDLRVMKVEVFKGIPDKLLE